MNKIPDSIFNSGSSASQAKPVARANFCLPHEALAQCGDDNFLELAGIGK